MPQPQPLPQPTPAQAPPSASGGLDGVKEVEQQQPAGYTIVVDNLPPHVSTTQLYVVFRRYGTVLRAWRSHHSQGMVTYPSKGEALAAAKGEDYRQIQEQALRVSPTFVADETPRKGYWRCVLCQWSNSVAATDCQGYMCGLQRTEGDLGAFDQMVDPLGFMRQAPQPPPPPQHMVSVHQHHHHHHHHHHHAQHMHHHHHHHHAHHHAHHVVPQPCYAAPPAEDYAAAQYRQPSYPQQPLSSAAPAFQPPPPPQPPQYEREREAEPEGPAVKYADACAPEEPAEAAAAVPPAMAKHCVIVTHVPTNITDRTLLKVFTKYASPHDGTPVDGFIRRMEPLTPRALTEAQVVFATREAAEAAVQGESGRLVDGERIVCKYATECFSLTAVPANPKQWAASVDEIGRQRLESEIGAIFVAYGAVDSIAVTHSGISVSYYTMSSAADAVMAEEGHCRYGSQWTLSLSAESRWPCMCCGRCSPASMTACGGCRSLRVPVDAVRWWELAKWAAKEHTYSPFDGCISAQDAAPAARRTSDGSGSSGRRERDEASRSDGLQLRPRRRKHRSGDGECDGSEVSDPTAEGSSSTATPVQSPVLTDSQEPHHGRGGRGVAPAQQQGGGWSLPKAGGRTSRGHRGSSRRK
eukprot:TRINITY_DN2635_c2_g1_i1.p1 TRINITY_DN2635_c2_g1~~TRINITY_DN2635_c2_g1_i1.p1  ORF type:complete len:637 (+),score=247.65 TRINITY_DN2635_c2_g1_i1:251-2161(+)